MPKVVYIYALVDPRDERIRYIGKTVNLEKRYEQHVYWLNGSNPRKENLISGLLKRGMKPIISVIEECDHSNWQEREKYWIAYYRELLPDLTNISDGGDDGWNCLKNRNKKVERFADRNGITVIHKCNFCGGLTISHMEICNHCMRSMFPDYENTDWYQFLTKDAHDFRRKEKHEPETIFVWPY